MISSKVIVEKANALIIEDNLSEINYTQLSSIEPFLNNSIEKVATLNDLPLASSNKGRMIYVISENSHFYSNGIEWSGDLTSEIEVLSSIAYAFGQGSAGRLGDGTTINRSSPVTVIGGITNWDQVSAGLGGSLGIANGIAYSWGGSTNGILGDNTGVSKSSPVTIVGGITNWRQLSAGSYHNLGITETGIAYAWGENSYGGLGDGTTINKSSPVSVIGGITNWKQVDSGSRHSLGLTETGVLYAWGSNTSFGSAAGQLGDGTGVNRSSPVTVIGGITNWKEIKASNVLSIGLTETGILYTWGGGFSGQLGDNTTVNKSSPVTVVGGITNWKSISSTGGGHVSAVTETGIAYAWGNNSNGRLGDNSTTSKSSPVTVVGGITNWKMVSSGGSHTIGLTEDGIIYGWGRNNNGQIGQATDPSSSPVSLVGGITNWSTVSAAGNHTLVLSSTTKGFD